MPKRTDIKKIMVIGSGPIVIGQAAEFDYAGTQACIALKEEGYEVVLVNSNPATIMTDTDMADKVYMEPLDLEHVARIIRHERPDGLLCSLGGQTGLNLGMQLHTKGILEECQVEMLGTDFDAIAKAEDRKLFKELCESIDEPVIESDIATSITGIIEVAARIGFPVVLRPAFTLGGTGGGFAESEEELYELAKNALKLSPVGQVLVEKSVKGFKEIEYEVLRDANDTVVAVCSMENVDPVGVHTGDSIVVCPCQTLTNKEYQMLRNAALKIIRALKIKGGCNVQFALDPYSFKYYVIEVNPRVSRSSALASKASGYPIARVSAKIACGLRLDEIQISSTMAAFEPTLDYAVAKFPRFPFDKFNKADRRLSTQMKATGEVMSLGRTIEESFLKAVRSLELGYDHLYLKSASQKDNHTLIDEIITGNDERIFLIAEAIRRDIPIDYLYRITKIDKFFLEKIANIIRMESIVAKNPKDLKTLEAAKRMGFSDEYIGKLWKMDFYAVYLMRKKAKIYPVYKMIDTCASEFKAYVPYFYSTYEDENESKISEKKKVVVLGSGPIRIGQGIEFDYSTVHAVWAIKEAGYEAIIINNNPETVSTDYTLSDKLYFEPLTFEDVMNIIDYEKPEGVVVALGGQTAINLASDLDKAGVKILGSSSHSIALAEDRDMFFTALSEMGIPMPEGRAVFNLKDGKNAAKEIGYPVLIRPSFVLGGRMMHIVYDEKSLVNYIAEAFELNKKHPVLIDKYIEGRECEVDAVCDGVNIFVPGIMEHIERAGVHSGDSMSVYPPYSLSKQIKEKIVDYTTRIGLGLSIIGPFNIQFVVDNVDSKIYIIEVNPRSSRTVPFLAKTTGAPIAKIATNVMLGRSLEELGYVGIHPEKKRWYVKSPTFSYSKLIGLDAVLSPEMKSTGEAIGYDTSFNRAVYKSIRASGMKVTNYGTVFATIADNNKQQAYPLIKRFYELGFNIAGTEGTAKYLRERGIRTRVRKKISQGSDEILTMLRKGYVTYVVNTISEGSKNEQLDGVQIRRTAVENSVPVFTSLDTVKALLDVLEEITMGISTINAE
ncbi:MAG: carbamoyl-phosphate synthase large subunit [Christensenellaceae bacterium]|jgi:carbamoyl-phosphate synthase large subunit|nr:carbamoyl-phosphate synthase large subunit [Christensenellaceae bacterium]